MPDKGTALSPPMNCRLKVQPQPDGAMQSYGMLASTFHYGQKSSAKLPITDDLIHLYYFLLYTINQQLQKIMPWLRTIAMNI